MFSYEGFQHRSWLCRAQRKRTVEALVAIGDIFTEALYAALPGNKQSKGAPHDSAKLRKSLTNPICEERLSISLPFEENSYFPIMLTFH